MLSVTDESVGREINWSREGDQARRRCIWKRVGRVRVLVHRRGGSRVEIGWGRCCQWFRREIDSDGDCISARVSRDRIRRCWSCEYWARG